MSIFKRYLYIMNTERDKNVVVYIKQSAAANKKIYKKIQAKKGSTEKKVIQQGKVVNVLCICKNFQQQKKLR